MAQMGKEKNDLFAVLVSLLDSNEILCSPNYPGLEKCYQFCAA
jgi:hypothetical protein